MNIDFPSNPTLYQIFNDPVSTKQWIWDGEKWLINPQPITTEQIADGAITTAKLANGAVTTEKIADGAVTAAKLDPNAVPSPIPVGSISLFAGSTAPSGWLLCNGQAVSRTTYSALFAVTSTTYGSGNGSSTFNVPNLSNRFPVGVGGSWASTLAGTGGSSAAVLLEHSHGMGDHAHDITHSHTSSLSGGGEHDHTGNTLKNATNTGSNHYVRPIGFPADETHVITNISGTHSHSVTVDPFSGSTGNSSLGSSGSAGVTSTGTQNLPPYIALNFIIKA